eukprot:scaffold121608_cov48-Phaeocystis_antarctica.AAC.1
MCIRDRARVAVGGAGCSAVGVLRDGLARHVVQGALEDAAEADRLEDEIARCRGRLRRLDGLLGPSELGVLLAVCQQDHDATPHVGPRIRFGAVGAEHHLQPHLESRVDVRPAVWTRHRIDHLHQCICVERKPVDAAHGEDPRVSRELDQADGGGRGADHELAHQALRKLLELRVVAPHAAALVEDEHLRQMRQGPIGVKISMAGWLANANVRRSGGAPNPFRYRTVPR